jgi:cbb3-type cytochrome oxidase subunit 3
MIELIKKIILYILLFILFYALLLYFFNITKKSPVKKNDWNNQNNPI